MSKEKLIFCPLGGSGEIGGNMNLYAYGEDDNQKWIIVDMGVSFADDSVPGVDLIMPDAGFIIDKKDSVGCCIDLIFFAKALERIGDHAKNMSESVIFMIRGKDLRHVG